MTMAPRFALVATSLLAALLLTIVPLPPWADPFRPEWVAMAVFFWSVTTPRSFNIGSSWLVGIALDVLSSSPLGHHALGMILASYLAITLHKSFRLFSMLQQLIIVAIVFALYRGLILWISAISGDTPTDALQQWAPLATTVFLWPWLYLLLTELGWRFRRPYPAE